MIFTLGNQLQLRPHPKLRSLPHHLSGLLQNLPANPAVQEEPIPEHHSAYVAPEPSAIPEPSIGGNQVDYNNNAYIDPTDYSTGATKNDDAPSSVVFDERSTGCQTVVQGGQDVSNSCNGAPPSPPPPEETTPWTPPVAVDHQPDDPSPGAEVVPEPPPVIQEHDVVPEPPPAWTPPPVHQKRYVAAEPVPTETTPWKAPIAMNNQPGDAETETNDPPAEYSETNDSASAVSETPETISEPSSEIAIEPINVGPLNVSPNGINLNAQNTYLNSLPDWGASSNLTPHLNGQLGNGNNIIFPLSIPAAITSAFGWRTDPISGQQQFHSGTDLGAPAGTPVLAAYSGKVETADWLGGYGLAVVIQHKQGSLETLYGHMSEIFVKPGDEIQQGKVIGRVGSTGYSTGPHLHFEIRQMTSQGWLTIDPGNQLEYALGHFVKNFQVAQLTKELKPPASKVEVKQNQKEEIIIPPFQFPAIVNGIPIPPQLVPLEEPKKLATTIPKLAEPIKLPESNQTTAAKVQKPTDVVKEVPKISLSKNDKSSK